MTDVLQSFSPSGSRIDDQRAGLRPGASAKGGPYIVSGLEDGRAAMIIKIHHAITDGVGGLQMAASLFDLTREPNTNLSLRSQRHPNHTTQTP